MYFNLQFIPNFFPFFQKLLVPISVLRALFLLCEWPFHISLHSQPLLHFQTVNYPSTMRDLLSGLPRMTAPQALANGEHVCTLVAVQRVVPLPKQ